MDTLDKVVGSIYTFLGAPGAGKGSLSGLCVSQLGWTQISTGNLCRWHIAEQTEVGREIDFAIKSGKLISDELMTNMVAEQLHRLAVAAERNVILDGYPRTVPQAKSLYEQLQGESARYVLRVVLLEIDKDEVVARLNSRMVCSNKACQAVYSTRFESGMRSKQAGICDLCGSTLEHRKDDAEETIMTRLAQYEKHVTPLIEFYESVGQRIVKLNANKPIVEVFANFKKIVGVQD